MEISVFLYVFFAYGNIGLGIAAAIASVIMLFHFTLGILLAKKV